MNINGAMIVLCVFLADTAVLFPYCNDDHRKYLNPNKEKEEIQKGYILKCGPGYALPSLEDSESWNPQKNHTNYLPLQVKAGDLAIFLQKGATEIKYNGEKYYIVPQNAIMLVERDNFE